MSQSITTPIANSIANHATIHTSSASTAQTGSLAGLVQQIAAFFRRRRLIAQTIHELSACSDRELDDLGIARCDIPMIARASADEVA